MASLVDRVLSDQSVTIDQKYENMSVMALATTSSAITLPIAMEESQNKLGLSSRITNLVLPLGMSLNSNGSAMHMAITVMTIAQMYQINFDGIQMVTITVTATFVSLANAVVPGAGLNHCSPARFTNQHCAICWCRMVCWYAADDLERELRRLFSAFDR